MSSGHGERRGADGNARRSRRFENGSVNRVHTFELGYIGKEDLRRDHVRSSSSSRSFSDAIVVEAGFPFGVELFWDLAGMDVKADFAGPIQRVPLENSRADAEIVLALI